MPEFNQNYNFNSLYICLLLLIYNILKSNYEYINIIFSKLYLLNCTSVIKTMHDKKTCVDKMCAGSTVIHNINGTILELYSSFVRYNIYEKVKIKAKLSL